MGVRIEQTKINETLGLASGQRWESTFLDAATIDAAYNDPSLAVSIGQSAVRRQAEQWQMSQKFALPNFETVTGIATSELSSVLTLAPELFRVTQATTTGQLGRGLAKVGIGAAMTLISASPIGGPVAVAIGAVSALFQALTRGDVSREARREILPPPSVYSKDVDQFWGNEKVLAPAQGLDWTSVFMPRFRGRWTVEKREKGKLSFGAEAPANGAGMIPNSQQMTGYIQMTKTDPRYVGRFYASDVGDFFPGSSQAAFAIGQVCNRPQTQLYGLDIDKIEQAWVDYYEQALDLAARIFRGSSSTLSNAGLSSLSTDERENLARQFVSRLTTGVGNRIGFPGPWSVWNPSGWAIGQTLKGKRDPGLISTTIVKPWAERMRKRQAHFLGTITGAAYTSPDQPAFANQALRSRLELMRAELLQRSALRSVDTAAVIDSEFRQQVFAKTVGATFGVEAPKLQGTEPFTPDTPPDADPGPPQGGVPFGTSGGSAAALALAAAVAVALLR